MPTVVTTSLTFVTSPQTCGTSSMTRTLSRWEAKTCSWETRTNYICQVCMTRYAYIHACVSEYVTSCSSYNEIRFHKPATLEILISFV